MRAEANADRARAYAHPKIPGSELKRWPLRTAYSPPPTSTRLLAY